MRPLLLLDVDGVLTTLGPGCREPVIEATANEMPLTIPERTAERLRHLGDHFQLVWATSWGIDANHHICPLLGLDPIGVVGLDEPFEAGETWKLPSIRRYVRDRPFAWADDEIGDDALEWAEARPEPCLLQRIHPGRGLDDDDVLELVGFAEGLGRGA